MLVNGPVMVWAEGRMEMSVSERRRVRHRQNRRARKRIVLSAVFGVARMFARVLPLGAFRFLGERAGLLAYRLDSKGREQALDNLRQALSDETSAKERDRICRGMFRNLGRVLAEILAFPGFSRRAVIEGLDCEMVLPVLRDLLKERRGVVLASAHLGNWEWLGGALAAHLGSICVVGKELRFDRFNDLVVSIREQMGVRTYYQDSSPRMLLSLLGQNHVLALLPDLNVERMSGIFVPFLGRPALTPSGPFWLAYKSGAPILPVFSIWDATSRGYRGVVGDVIRVRGEDRNAAIREACERWSQEAERRIREHPEQWIWLHRRWQTSTGEQAPGGEVIRPSA